MSPDRSSARRPSPWPVRWQRSWRHQVDCLSQRAWVLADAVHAGHSEDRGKCVGPGHGTGLGTRAVIPDSVFSSSVIDAGWRYRMPDRFKPLESFTRDTMGRDSGSGWRVAICGPKPRAASPCRSCRCQEPPGYRPATTRTAGSTWSTTLRHRASSGGTTPQAAEWSPPSTRACSMPSASSMTPAVLERVVGRAAHLHAGRRSERARAARPIRRGQGQPTSSRAEGDRRRMNDANRLQVECIPVASARRAMLGIASAGLEQDQIQPDPMNSPAQVTGHQHGVNDPISSVHPQLRGIHDNSRLTPAMVIAIAAIQASACRAKPAFATERQ
ncbi:hypothetical protein SNK04_014177 [Fusarium graminearum]